MKRRIGATVLAAIAVLVAVNTFVTTRQTKPAKADGGRIVAVAGGHIQVVETGPAGAPPIVLLHGFDASWHWWVPTSRLLARDHRVISVDLLGHGGSSKPRKGYSMENQARLVAEVMRQLHVSGAIVAGHSMGGGVAVALATANPALVKGLVIVDQPARSDDGKLGLTARLGFLPVVGPLLFRTAPSFLVKDGFKVAFAKGFKVPGFVVQDYRRMTFSSYDSAAKGDDDYLKEKALDKRVAALHKPVMVIFGRDEQLAKKNAYARYVGSGAQVRLVANAGHSPMYEQPRRTADLILAFERRYAR